MTQPYRLQSAERVTIFFFLVQFRIAMTARWSDIPAPLKNDLIALEMSLVVGRSSQ